MCKYINKKHLDRYPSAPVIMEGFPRNQTALENATVDFECPLISDLGILFTLKLRICSYSIKFLSNFLPFTQAPT